MKHFIYKKNSLGFTLIELLIVIAILGILAAGILVAIDPIDKIKQANDSKVQNDVSAMGRASEAYATTHDGFYPSTLTGLVTAGELKRKPGAPSGYDAYYLTVSPDPCNPGETCTSITIIGQLRSKRYTATPVWRYESSTGKSCTVVLETDDCP